MLVLRFSMNLCSRRQSYRCTNGPVKSHETIFKIIKMACALAYEKAQDADGRLLSCSVAKAGRNQHLKEEIYYPFPPHWDRRAM
jgi:hypothetical protein